MIVGDKQEFLRGFWAAYVIKGMDKCIMAGMYFMLEIS